MSRYIHESHGVTVLLYHFVSPAKHRRAVIDATVDQVLREVCLEIEARHQPRFPEIGPDEDHVHFLVQSAPTYSASKVVTILKSLTAREIFRRCPGVKKRLWGGEFWTDGHFASTVGRHGNEKVIAAHVKRQGSGYRKLHEQRQLALFWNTPPLGRGSFILDGGRKVWFPATQSPSRARPEWTRGTPS